MTADGPVCAECGNDLAAEGHALCLDCLEALGTYPYDGTSGYAAGSPSSEDRARQDDASGVTAARQVQALTLITDHGVGGLTWRELADATGMHHGQASAVLSVLHKTGRLARLADRRGRSSVYVTPELVDGRDTQAHGSARRLGPRYVLSHGDVTAALSARGLTGRDAARARNAMRDMGIDIAR